MAHGQDVWTSSQIFSPPALPLSQYVHNISLGIILTRKQKDRVKFKNNCLNLKPVSGVQLVSRVKIKIAAAKGFPLQLHPPPPKKEIRTAKLAPKKDAAEVVGMI